jgi:hypothetical protein
MHVAWLKKPPPREFLNGFSANLITVDVRPGALDIVLGQPPSSGDMHVSIHCSSAEKRTTDLMRI